jgi:hypothetical protein
MAGFYPFVDAIWRIIKSGTVSKGIGVVALA